MSYVRIDQQLCNGCGWCVRICPHKAIELGNGTAEYIAQECFLCGHCYAVCPENAVLKEGFRDAGYSFADAAYVAPGISDPISLTELIRSRRSCRNYQQKDVPLAILQQLVDVGCAAPSGTNSQGWSYILLPERAAVSQFGEVVGSYYKRLNRQAENPLLRLVLRLFGLRGLENYYRNYYASVKEALTEWEQKRIDRLFHGAPALICVTGSDAASCAAEDALLVTQNMLLAAHAMGLGSCLIGFAVEAAHRSRQVRQALNLQEGETLYAVIALGYPAVAYKRVAPRRVIVPRIVSAEKVD